MNPVNAHERPRPVPRTRNQWPFFSPILGPISVHPSLAPHNICRSGEKDLELDPSAGVKINFVFELAKCTRGKSHSFLTRGNIGADCAPAKDSNRGAKACRLVLNRPGIKAGHQSSHCSIISTKSHHGINTGTARNHAPQHITAFLLF
nr:SNF2 domain-containing protein CLASSY 3-like [Ipomoea batatas]